MTSMPTASDGAPDAADPVDRTSPAVDRGTRPVRLVMWDSGGGIHDEVVATGDTVDVGTWILRSRSDHPGRMRAVVYDDAHDLSHHGAATGATWRDRLRSVEECMHAVSRHPQPAAAVHRWSGDTTTSSLALLRRWVTDVLWRHASGVATVEAGRVRSAAVTTAVSDTVLLVDELASNVVEHAAGRLTVELTVTPERVLIVVPDPDPGHPPTLGHPPAEQPSGRGLLVVDALSLRWGIVIGRTSKAVWAEVDWPS